MRIPWTSDRASLPTTFALTTFRPASTSPMPGNRPSGRYAASSEVESKGCLISDLGIVSNFRRPMLKHNAGRGLHNEGRPPRLNPRHAAGFQLSNSLVGDFIIEIRPVLAGVRPNSLSRHRGSPRRAPRASLAACNPSRQNPAGTLTLNLLREGSKPDGRDAARLGSREPGAAAAARAQTEKQRRLKLRESGFLRERLSARHRSGSEALENASSVLLHRPWRLPGWQIRLLSGHQLRAHSLKRAVRGWLQPSYSLAFREPIE
jgi:hypothetical protein